MKKFDIDKNFFYEYLMNGVNYTDNVMFLNCPTEFLNVAKEELSKNIALKCIKPCCVKIDRDMEEKLEFHLKHCATDFQRQLIARDFVCTLIKREILKHYKDKNSEKHMLNLAIQDYMDDEFYKVKNFHPFAPMPSDITQASKNLDRIELNLFLDNTQNVYVQQAINNFISSREPYSVKLFTNNINLPTYYDQLGTLIQAPHDYRNVDVNKHIKMTDIPSKDTYEIFKPTSNQISIDFINLNSDEPTP